MFRDVFSKDQNARRFAIGNDRVEGQLQGPAIAQLVVGSKRAFRERPLIKRREYCRFLRREQALAVHPHLHPDAITVFESLLEGAIECKQAVIEVHGPDEVLDAIYKRGEVGFSLIAHF